jgi:TRAP transporter 4TM/12TM fusion protein
MAIPDTLRTRFASAAEGLGLARSRGLSETADIVILIYAALVSLAHIAINTMLVLPDLWVSAFHFASLAPLVVLLYPLFGGTARRGDRGVLIADLVIGGLAIAASLAVLVLEDALYARGLRFSNADWIACLLVVAVAIELTRRTAGLLIPVLILLFLGYAVWWGARIGGVFAFPGLSLETMLFRSVFTSEGMFGTIARISWTYVFMFILFGAFLVRSGAGDFMIALARAAAGRITGGPGLVAVASSGLMGSITGSAVANTASTGVITIPLMKRAGFHPRFAAGVEAAASTGGQLMPPVMGAGAFLMANFTGISYLAIIAAALIPAVLYFLSVAFFVRIHAMKHGLVPQADEGAIPFSDAIRRGWPLLLPSGRAGRPARRRLHADLRGRSLASSPSLPHPG